MAGWDASCPADLTNRSDVSFDIYLGESFEQAVTDQVAFLRDHLLENATG